MGTSDGRGAEDLPEEHPAEEHPARGGGGQRALTALGYLALFLLGVVQGFIGSFQYGQPPTPVIAVILVVVLFATCLACGWGVGTVGAGLLPAVGWILTSFILAMPKSNGSVIITATTAGEWYLYGGALAAAAGAVASFFFRLRRPLPPRRSDRDPKRVPRA